MKTQPNSLRSAIAALCAGIALSTASLSVLAHEPDSTLTTEARTMTSQLFASPSQVRLVQEELRERGFDPGRVDGVWGDETTSAVTRFQKSAGLAQTGQLDTSLLSALDIGDVLEGETSAKFLDGLLRNERSDKVVSGYGAALFVSPAHVAQIQHLLQARGFYSGPIDGMWGDDTATAANKYRTAMGLEHAPNLDVTLLQTLNQQGSEIPKLSTRVTARTAGVPLYAGPETLRAMQRELSAKGHDAGAIDGQWGANTRDALRDFQREHSLETTGTLTLPTLAALGVGVKDTDRSAFESRTRNGTPVQEDEPDAVAEDRD